MKAFLIFIAILFFASSVYGAWTYNIDNDDGDDLDYYQDLQTDSGVTVPQDYIASPTAELLRDLLIAAGIMSPAPEEAVPAAVVFQDSTNLVFQDGTNAVFQDSVE